MTFDHPRAAFRRDLGTYLEARTDAKGEFLLRRAGEGTWTVRAYHASGLPGGTTVTLPAEGGETACEFALRPAAWAEVEIVAPVAGEFVSRVWIDTQTQSADATFQLESLPDEERRAHRSGRRVGSGGRIRLGPLETGTYRIRGRATLPVPGTDETVAVDRDETVEVREGETTRLTFRIGPEDVERARGRR